MSRSTRDRVRELPGAVQLGPEVREALAKLIANAKSIDELTVEMTESAAAISQGAAAMKSDLLADQKRLENESHAMIGETEQLILMLAAGPCAVAAPSPFPQLPGWPVVTGDVDSTPTVGDVDVDGVPDVAFTSFDALLHVVDATSTALAAQHATVLATLEDLGLAELPTLTVLNKADELTVGDRVYFTAVTFFVGKPGRFSTAMR